ncbi:Band 7 protein family and Stomatin family-containing protein [Aphelenchoides besseyi]|nr:Band 7 protein family and Stomatin family-containing protein [Aphelenchoides besseyi]KAI6209733.1 Band 7 protein family and Stomatin family-containing protein [Aphelenchoides besseyi]
MFETDKRLHANPKSTITASDNSWGSDFDGLCQYTRRIKNGRRNNNFMLPGQNRYSPSDGFHTNPLLTHQEQSRSLTYYIFLALAWFLFFCTIPFSLFFCIKVVHEYKRLVVFRLGRLKRSAMGPGVVLILPCIDEHHSIDLRAQSYEIPQEILTKDGVTVVVDAVVYFRTNNATSSVANVEDCGRSTRLLAQTTLRNVLGTRSLSEIMSERESIAIQAQEVLDEGTDPWGIKVERVEVKDIRVPKELTRVLAAEAEASRTADAKVVHAQGELDASAALRTAATQFDGSSTAIQLRYLQTLSRISTHKNHTLVIPIPMELIKRLLNQRRKNS